MKEKTLRIERGSDWEDWRLRFRAWAEERVATFKELLDSGYEAATDKLVLYVPPMSEFNRKALKQTIESVAPAALVVVAGNLATNEAADDAGRSIESVALDTTPSPDAPVGDTEFVYIDSHTPLSEYRSNYPELAKEDKLDGKSFYADIVASTAGNFDHILEAANETSFKVHVEAALADLDRLEKNSAFITSIVKNAHEKVASGKTLVETLQESMEFRDTVPEEAQEIFRSLLPGWAGLESGYRRNARSKKGALGYMQLMEAVRQQYARKGEDVLSPEAQGRMAGALASDMYERAKFHVTHSYNGEKKKFEIDKNGEAIITLLKEKLGPTEFIKFKAYGTVVSYNTGDRRFWGGAVKSYVLEFGESIPDGITAEDLFVAVIEYAHKSKEGLNKQLGDDGLKYLPRAIAVTKLMSEADPRQPTTEIAAQK